VAVLVAGGLVVAACGGSGGHASTVGTTPDPAPPPTFGPATTTAPTPSDEEQIAATYRAFWTVAIDAGDPPDPRSALLGDVATGEALAGLQSGLRNFSETGRALRLPVPTVSGVFDLAIEVSGDAATISACVIDDAIAFDRVNGRVLNDQIASGPVEAVARRSADGWRIERSSQPIQEEGVGGCQG
jgi:hypothetical protein